VNDLIDEPNKNIMSGNLNSGHGPGSAPSSLVNMTNATDKEAKNLAMRIKKCPNFKQYKQQFASSINFNKQQF
jgi:hypothetical protein